MQVGELPWALPLAWRASEWIVDTVDSGGQVFDEELDALHGDVGR
jgi:hypothetical protein